MTPSTGRSNGSRRLGALFLGVTLIGGLFVPTAALAVGPSVTINLAAGQSDYTGASTINFTVVFTDPVEGFTGEDVTISRPPPASGTATATVTGGPKTYNVAVTGMTTTGQVIASVPAGAAFNPAGEPNLASTSDYNTVFWYPGGPSVTINQSAGQADPTGIPPINFTVVFSANVAYFDVPDVVLSGTAGGEMEATITVVTGAVYIIGVTGMTTNGTVIATVRDAAAVDASNRPSLASTSTDNTVTWQAGATVSINQAMGQADPTGMSPINFAVVFSAPVTGFTTGDVTITGTAGGTKTATITGSGTTYNVAVTGMTTAGTVSATVPADIAIDASARPNFASTSTDNTVTWTPGAPASAITLTTTAPIPPGAKDPVILWGQGFTLGVQFGTNGANKSFELQGTRDELTWTRITTLTTDANGRASLVYRPVTNLFYRAAFAGTPDLAAAISNEVRTVVRQLAVMRPTNNGSTKAISRNTSVTFSTTVRPSRPELAPATVTFSFYRQVSGTWQRVTSRAVAVDSAGVARTTFQFTTPGQWYVRSQAGPTPYNANSVPNPAERYSVS